jgi:hypothetical protein
LVREWYDKDKPEFASVQVRGAVLREAIVVSKKQARAVGDALTQGNRDRITSMPYQFHFFPELEKIPSADRDDALSDSKRRAFRSVPVIVACCLFPLSFGAMYLSYEPGSDWVGPFITAFVALTSICGAVFRWRVRRELLHSEWRPRSTPLSKVMRASKTSGHM